MCYVNGTRTTELSLNPLFVSRNRHVKYSIKIMFSWSARGIKIYFSHERKFTPHSHITLKCDFWKALIE